MASEAAKGIVKVMTRNAKMDADLIDAAEKAWMPPTPPV